MKFSIQNLCIVGMFLGCQPQGEPEGLAFLSPVKNSQKVVLVYTGPGTFASVIADKDSTAKDLRDNLLKEKGSTSTFQVSLVTAGQFARHLSPENRKKVALIAFPGGPSEALMAEALSKAGEFDLIKDYVKNGGNYLGICAGAYLAGSFVTNDDGTPQESVKGFDFLPARSRDQADKQTVLAFKMGYEDAEAKAELQDITWRDGRKTQMYFQNGPSFFADESKAKIFARFSKPATHKDGTVYHPENPNAAAALIVPYFRGKVALIGLHPEADQTWLDEDQLATPAPKGLSFTQQLGIELISELLK